MIPAVLQTSRATLRPWAIADVADVLAYAADEEWGRYLPVPQPYREADAQAFVASQLSLDGHEEFAWALEHDGRVIGGINLRRFSEGLVAEIDYAIARAFWGRGIGTETAVAVVDAAFAAFAELVRVRSMIDARNLASARVLEKVGMRREGVLRSNKLERGELVDEVWYGILRTEWDSDRAARR